MAADVLDTLTGIATGLVLLFSAGRLRAKLEQERLDRLARLEAGADEAFFEEKRSLEAYPALGVTALRLLGGALLLGSLALALWGSG